MTAEEEVILLRQENQALRERVHVQQETIEQQQHLIEGLQKQTAELAEQVQALQERMKKDSHNSHLPPSSDRFHRQPKSLRKKSGKQPGGQAGHAGNTLKLSPTPDLVIVHPVEHCLHCQHDLRMVESLAVERRQVIDLPPKRVLVIEHQAHQKCCPACQQISLAAFPGDVRAPVQYGAAIGAVGVYLVQQQLEPVEQQIKAALARAQVLHQDETGLYVAGQRHWMHESRDGALDALCGPSQTGQRGA